MANAFKKMAGFLGLVEEEEMDLAPAIVAEPRRSVRPVTSTTPSWAQSNVTAVTSVPVRPAAVAEQRELPIMDRIITIHPRFYNEARNIGEHYREGQPVIMNLSDMEESERKRLVDFASGLVFGHHGSIERVTSKVFLLTPPNVMVSVEDKAAAAEASFFNQS
ncbi:MAG: cell division protein SepF [Actinomycetes bacterium]